MARATLTPTILAADSVANGLSANSTTTVTAAGGNGVLIPNTLASFLVVNVGTTITTLTVVIGTTVLGQAVTSFSIPLAASATYIIGPFHSALNQPGVSQVAIDFSSATNITVGAFQLSGVF